jgi:hypothetical protein
VLGPERYELRHHHGRRPRFDAGGYEGARAAQASEGVQSIGIRVHLPFEQDVNPFVEQVFEHATFFRSYTAWSIALRAARSRPPHRAAKPDRRDINRPTA